MIVLRRGCPSCGENVSDSNEAVDSGSKNSVGKSIALVVLAIVYFPAVMWVAVSSDSDTTRYEPPRNQFLQLLSLLLFFVILPLLLTHSVWAFRFGRNHFHWVARLLFTVIMYAWPVGSLFYLVFWLSAMFSE